eukprot:scaffold9839_cov157-Skeletonema_marinoi.AAC.12
MAWQEQDDDEAEAPRAAAVNEKRFIDCAAICGLWEYVILAAPVEVGALPDLSELSLHTKDGTQTGH